MLIKHLKLTDPITSFILQRDDDESIAYMEAVPDIYVKLYDAMRAPFFGLKNLVLHCNTIKENEARQS